MIRTSKPDTKELTLLLREAIRLLELGSNATAVEREAYRVWKADLLERLAAHRAGLVEREQSPATVRTAGEPQIDREDAPSLGGEL
jgi:hypothetical protein